MSNTSHQTFNKASFPSLHSSHVNPNANHSQESRRQRGMAEGVPHLAPEQGKPTPTGVDS